MSTILNFHFFFRVTLTQISVQSIFCQVEDFKLFSECFSRVWTMQGYMTCQVKEKRFSHFLKSLQSCRHLKPLKNSRNIYCKKYIRWEVKRTKNCELVQKKNLLLYGSHYFGRIGSNSLTTMRFIKNLAKKISVNNKKEKYCFISVLFLNSASPKRCSVILLRQDVGNIVPRMAVQTLF